LKRMAEVYLARRREFLLKAQNPDGGWGYFPGKASWLEPTAYAMLALHGDETSSETLKRAWRLLESWQLADGSWRAGAQVQDGTWVTALAVTLCSFDGQSRGMLERGVHHLLLTVGAERSTTFRLMEFFGLGEIEADTTHPAWPWRHGTSSWIEPTAHTLVALKRARKRFHDRRLAWRIREGEQMVLTRRCADGGWNHGSPNTFHIDAPSYPESTALALMGLQGRRRELGPTLDLARSQWRAAESPLATAWLSIALQTWGESIAAPDDTTPIRNDIMLTALETLAHPQGNHALLRTGEAA
jgi:hypothetical protein